MVRKVFNFKISALTNTWFERAALDLIKICRLISYFLLLNFPRQLFLQEELPIASHGSCFDKFLSRSMFFLFCTLMLSL